MKHKLKRKEKNPYGAVFRGLHNLDWIERIINNFTT